MLLEDKLNGYALKCAYWSKTNILLSTLGIKTKKPVLIYFRQLNSNALLLYVCGKFRWITFFFGWQIHFEVNNLIIDVLHVKLIMSIHFYKTFTINIISCVLSVVDIVRGDRTSFWRRFGISKSIFFSTT